MAKKNRPRSGSLGYKPKVKAERPYPNIEEWEDTDEEKPLGFAGYKAGMTRVLMVQNEEGPSKGQESAMPVTILEAPPLRVYGARFYTEDINNGETVYTEAWTDSPSPELQKATDIPKNGNMDNLGIINPRQIQLYDRQDNNHNWILRENSDTGEMIIRRTDGQTGNNKITITQEQTTLNTELYIEESIASNLQLQDNQLINSETNQVLFGDNINLQNTNNIEGVENLEVDTINNQDVQDLSSQNLEEVLNEGNDAGAKDITNVQNLGVGGESNPDDQLDVDGNANIEGDLDVGREVYAEGGITVPELKGEADNCREIKNNAPWADSGVYNITPGNQELEVYCDMDFNGGGWTLIHISRSNFGDNRFYNAAYDDTFQNHNMDQGEVLTPDREKSGARMHIDMFDDLPDNEADYYLRFYRVMDDGRSGTGEILFKFPEDKSRQEIWDSVYAGNRRSFDGDQYEIWDWENSQWDTVNVDGNNENFHEQIRPDGSDWYHTSKPDYQGNGGTSDDSWNRYDALDASWVRGFYEPTGNCQNGCNYDVVYHYAK